MKFREFIGAYNSGSIGSDASWRAYDIVKMVNGMTALRALKYLRYAGAANFAIAKVAADYQIDTFERAKHLLEVWFVWYEISTGVRTRKLIMRKGSGND